MPAPNSTSALLGPSRQQAPARLHLVHRVLDAISVGRWFPAREIADVLDLDRGEPPAAASLQCRADAQPVRLHADDRGAGRPLAVCAAPPVRGRPAAARAGPLPAVAILSVSPAVCSVGRSARRPRCHHRARWAKRTMGEGNWPRRRPPGDLSRHPGRMIGIPIRTVGPPDRNNHSNGLGCPSATSGSSR